MKYVVESLQKLKAGFIPTGITPQRTVSARIIHEANQSLEATLERLQTTTNGLSFSETSRRLAQNGNNEVAHEKPAHWARELMHAFGNPFVFVLLTLAGISYFTDVYFAPPHARDWSSIIIVLTMACISGLLRFMQEHRSAKAAENLKSLVSARATVLRRASDDSPPAKRDIAMNELVTGDVVCLEAGDMVPADIRLIESRDLFISQAALTGEALPVEKYDTLGSVSEKSVGRAISDQTSLLELPNICFMGTNVVSGTATAIAIATGADTYFGTLAKSLSSRKRVETSFDRGINSVSWLLIRFMLVMVPVVFMINGLTKGDWISALTFSLAVAVGLTPEMLPMIVSANLAKGAVAMARRKVIVKRLNSVQNFGAMDVLCTDKTGTLTQDKIILEQHLDVYGNKDERILQLAWLNSHYQSGQKNLMDRAIVSHADALDYPVQLGRYSKVDELPFDFVRRRLSVVLRNRRGHHLMVSKGAVEEMLAVCTQMQDDTGLHPLNAATREAVLRLARDFNEDGFRVLLVATRCIDPADERPQYRMEDEKELVLRGILTFLDPPKDSAAPAIRALQEHGVAVKVLTGDTAAVTMKVCRDVGLDVVTPLSGLEIDALDDDALKRTVSGATVFVKLTPLHKARIVKALQSNDHTVGFLGDGINDAPALRDADVGISVDSAADIAKETADIILLEKSLMVLEEGVIKGRETFGNILKYLNMTASSNFGNVFSVLVASVWLPWQPMLALQLLTQNLIYDISQMMLPWDHMDADFLKAPRKWDAGHIGRFMVWLGPTSSVFDMTTFILLWTVFGAGAAFHAHGGLAGQSIMSSGWFIEGLVSQTLVVHMLRTRKIPFIQSTAALPVLLSTGTAIAIGCWLPYSPLGPTLGFQGLGHAFWGWLAATLLAYALLAQLVKTVYMRRYGRWF